MPEARASGIFVDGLALARSDLAFDLLILEERQQQAIREHFRAIIINCRLQVHAAKTESERVVMKTKASSKAGFTLVEIMIVVAIIGLLAAIAIPNFVRARTTSQKDACISNLRQIDGAAQTWALENNKAPADTYTLDNLITYLGRGSAGAIPTCPANGTYSPGATVGNPPSCSLSAAGHVIQ
jgi:prepilin-type N-terminal cleavage/methylation domain-containing protein